MDSDRCVIRLNMVILTKNIDFCPDEKLRL